MHKGMNEVEEGTIWIAEKRTTQRNIMCIGGGSMIKELTHINMARNFNYYDSDQLKTLTEFLLKARRNSKSFVVYFLSWIISPMRTGSTMFHSPSCTGI